MRLLSMQDKRIEHFRRRLSVHGCKLHKIPRWAKTNARKACKRLGIRVAWDPLDDLARWVASQMGKGGPILDHVGSYRHQHFGQVLVTEPYADERHADTAAAMARFAAELDARMGVSPIGWWNCPSTVRYEFINAEEFKAGLAKINSELEETDFGEAE